MSFQSVEIFKKPPPPLVPLDHNVIVSPHKATVSARICLSNCQLLLPTFSLRSRRFIDFFPTNVRAVVPAQLV